MDWNREGKLRVLCVEVAVLSHLCAVTANLTKQLVKAIEAGLPLLIRVPMSSFSTLRGDVLVQMINAIENQIHHTLKKRVIQNHDKHFTAIHLEVHLFLKHILSIL